MIPFETLNQVRLDLRENHLLIGWWFLVPGRLNQNFIVRTLNMKKYVCGKKQIEAVCILQIHCKGGSHIVVCGFYNDGFIFAVLRCIHITWSMTCSPAACFATTMSGCEYCKVIYFTVTIVQRDRKSCGRNKDETSKNDMYNLSKHAFNADKVQIKQ